MDLLQSMKKNNFKECTFKQPFTGMDFNRDLIERRIGGTKKEPSMECSKTDYNNAPELLVPSQPDTPLPTIPTVPPTQSIH
jgi:hypothetical protein